MLPYIPYMDPMVYEILSRPKLIDDFPSYKPPFIVDLPLLINNEIGMVYWDYNLGSTPKFGIQIL